MDEFNKPESVTRIAKGTRVTADIQTDSDIHIAGTVKGDIETSGNVYVAGQVQGNIHSKQHISLNSNGQITGTIVCKRAQISGKLTGEIRATEDLKISSTANVDGFFFTAKISVEEQAKLIGFIQAGPDVDVLNAKIEGQKKISAGHKTVQTESVKPEKDSITKSDSEVEKQENPPKQAEIKPLRPKNRYVAELLIGIPGDVSEELTNPVYEQAEKVLNALKYELEIFDEPKSAPYFYKLTYVKKSDDNEEVINNQFSSAREVIESSFLKKDEEEADNALQKATIHLTNAIKKLDSIAIQIGQILILKFKSGDVQTIAVEEINGKLSEILKKEPYKITDPETLYALL